MQIVTNITRFDLVRSRLVLVLAPGFYLYLFLCLAVWMTYLDMPYDLRFGWVVALGFCVLTAWNFAIVLLIFVAFTLIEIWIMPGYRRGVLGEHRLAITEEGLEEATDFNRTVHPWHSIDKVWERFGLLLVCVGPGWHIIPRRTFASKEARSAFIGALQQHRQGAAPLAG